MLFTLLMLVWTLAICWLRSDGQAQNINSKSLATETVVSMQDRTHNEKVKLQKQAKIELPSVETHQSSSLNASIQAEVEEEIVSSVTSVEKVIEPPIYEKDWKSSCCLTTNKSGKKLSGVTLKQRISKLTKLEVLI
jgi:hypothetical protein